MPCSDTGGEHIRLKVRVTLAAFFKARWKNQPFVRSELPACFMAVLSPQEGPRGGLCEPSSLPRLLELHGPEGGSF